MGTINQFINNDLSQEQFILIALIFIWSGFVRSGLGFGGAALALPLLLHVYDKPLVLVPIIGTHLLFFTAITMITRLHNVNWSVLWKVMVVLFIPKVAGLIGLLSLPNNWLVILVFAITLFYGATWLFNYTIKSQSKAVDFVLLMVGGYVSGTSLIGAPMMVVVMARYISKFQLRDTLFMLWMVLVIMKMGAFVAYDVDLQWRFSLILLPFVAVGHVIGLRTHEYLVSAEGGLFHRVLGAALITVSTIGLVKYYT